MLVELKASSNSTDLQTLAKDLAMQVAATSPLAVAPEGVDPEVLAKEKAIFEAQAKESGKPEKIIERMVSGRLEKFLKEVCLVEQAFVKNPDITVAQLLKEAGAASGGEVGVARFVRYQVGG